MPNLVSGRTKQTDSRDSDRLIEHAEHADSNR
jgi:hypothetical protein